MSAAPSRGVGSKGARDVGYPAWRATLTGTWWLILTTRGAIDALSKMISPVDVPNIADS
jgi:hypothetical protein